MAAASAGPEASAGGVFSQGSRGLSTARQGEVASCRGRAAPIFDETPLEKAQFAFDESVEKARVELDDKIFVYKGSEDMTRQTHGQVTRDLSRLLEQIKDLSRMNSEAIDLMTHRVRGGEEHARAAHTADA